MCVWKCRHTRKSHANCHKYLPKLKTFRSLFRLQFVWFSFWCWFDLQPSQNKQINKQTNNTISEFYSSELNSKWARTYSFLLDKRMSAFFCKYFNFLRLFVSIPNNWLHIFICVMYPNAILTIQLLRQRFECSPRCMASILIQFFLWLKFFGGTKKIENHNWNVRLGKVEKRHENAMKPQECINQSVWVERLTLALAMPPQPVWEK